MARFEHRRTVGIPSAFRAQQTRGLSAFHQRSSECNTGAVRVYGGPENIPDVGVVCRGTGSAGRMLSVSADPPGNGSSRTRTTPRDYWISVGDVFGDSHFQRVSKDG